MKNPFAFILKITALVSIFFLSCNKEDELVSETGQDNESITIEDVSETTTINLSANDLSKTTRLEFTDSKDAALIIIQSADSWTADSDSDWLLLTSETGFTGSTGILIGATKNTSFPREGQITIVSGSRSHVITVNQQGTPEINFTVKDVSFRMRLVEGDTFILGNDLLYGSTPAHNVILSTYYICETEVTNGLWYAVMNNLPYDTLSGFEDHDEYSKMKYPVSAVTWGQVTNEFLPALKTVTGKDFRLPTEAEWEFAASGGKSGTGYDYAGGDILEKVGWHEFNSGNEKHEVRQLLPNELGIYDMSGNVSEWCSDWYSYYYSVETTNNPSGPQTGSEKVVRGGNYTSNYMFSVGECGVKYRSFIIPSCYSGCWGDTGNPDEPICFRCKTTGFRFVLPV